MSTYKEELVLKRRVKSFKLNQIEGFNPSFKDLGAVLYFDDKACNGEYFLLFEQESVAEINAHLKGYSKWFREKGLTMTNLTEQTKEWVTELTLRAIAEANRWHGSTKGDNLIYLQVVDDFVEFVQVLEENVPDLRLLTECYYDNWEEITDRRHIEAVAKNLQLIRRHKEQLPPWRELAINMAIYCHDKGKLLSGDHHDQEYWNVCFTRELVEKLGLNFLIAEEIGDGRSFLLADYVTALVKAISWPYYYAMARQCQDHQQAESYFADLLGLTRDFGIGLIEDLIDLGLADGSAYTVLGGCLPAFEVGRVWKLKKERHNGLYQVVGLQYPPEVRRTLHRLMKKLNKWSASGKNRIG